jgi:uncharacterized membrane protein YkvA (DUF1232 family)
MSSNMSGPAKRTAKKVAASKVAASKAAKTAPAKKTAAKKTAAKRAPAKKPPTTKTATPRRTKRISVREKYRAVAAGAAGSTFFAAARKRAAAIVDSPEKLRRLAEDTTARTNQRGGTLSEVVDDLRAMVRLVVAYAKGDYRDISGETLVLVVGAMIYVVSPLDLIPDFVPVAGYADDAAVVLWVVQKVRGEIDAFRSWESAQP